MGRFLQRLRGAGPAAGRADDKRPQRETAGKMHFFCTSARHLHRDHITPTPAREAVHAHCLGSAFTGAAGQPAVEM
jgi:hypothetical protein